MISTITKQKSFQFSIIIPVYNRPKEIDELLISLVQQNYNQYFEVIVVEDGSSLKADKVCAEYQKELDINYFYKKNSGPGLSRNFGMQNAKGNYFIILDSDVILPPNYLSVIANSLKINFTDVFGGADAAHPSFTVVQKAINYSMTSILTTGGLRGHKNNTKFQPRSFNMGLSKEAFQNSGGFSSQRIGEDIDLTFRLWHNGFESQFIKQAFVYHKRRTNFKQFFNQVYNFGKARPILNKQHKNTAKISYWFPSVFLIGFLLSLIMFPFSQVLTAIYLLYLLLIFMDSLLKNKHVLVGFLSVYATLTQMFGYGLGFLQSQFYLHVLGKSPQDTFPKMFA